MFFLKTILSYLRDREYLKLLFITVTVIGCGSVTYRYLEGWSWIDAVYFSVITITTIGYGDVAPQTDGGKVFTIFYIIIGLGVILNFIDTVHDHYRKEDMKDNKESDN